MPRRQRTFVKPTTTTLKSATGPVALLVGTRKGAFIVRGDRSRRTWKLSAPMFLGHIVHHLVLDPRDGRTLLAAARTGHLGPTVFRSTDFGKTWKEAQAPPAFPKVPEGQKGLVVDHVFWLTPGHRSEPNMWYAGTSPQGLFRSEDGGQTWEGVKGFNEHPMRQQWTGGEQVGAHRGQYAQASRRYRVLHRPASPRSGDGLGVPDGRHGSLAAGQPGRQALGVHHSRRGQKLDEAGQGLSEESGLVDCQTPGHDSRCSQTGRTVLRNHRRRDLGQPDRRTAMGLSCQTRARDLLSGGRRVVAMKVLIPSSLRSYTGQKHEVEADGATLGDVLSDLDRRYRCIRFRIITEQDTVRPHIAIYINEDPTRNLTTPLRPGDQILIITALSGG